MQLALGQHHVGEIEPREFVLLRQRLVRSRRGAACLEQPVVERAMVLELQRADRMRDVLQRIGDGVRVVVHRIDAPLVAGAVVMRWRMR